MGSIGEALGQVRGGAGVARGQLKGPKNEDDSKNEDNLKMKTT